MKELIWNKYRLLQQEQAQLEVALREMEKSIEAETLIYQFMRLNLEWCKFKQVFWLAVWGEL